MAKAVAKPVLEEVSAESRDRFGDAFVAELAVSRDEVLITHGGGDLTLYERLLRDDQVYPTFQQRRAAVVARPWKVDAGGPSDLDTRAADSLRAQLQALGWDRTTYRMLTGLMYGYAVGECMFAADAGIVTLTGVKVRKSRRFRFGTDGSLRLLTAGTPAGEVMPEQKFWVFTAGADDDDDAYGRGLGHWLYWPVWFKRNALQWWGLFLERFAIPTPYAKVPAGTTEPERNKLLRLMEAIINGGKVVFPAGIDLQLLQAMKDSGGDFEKFVSRMDATISKIVLTQTMTTDDGSSMSQATVHERMLGIVTKTDADIACESFSRGPGAWLTQWNFPGAAPPVVYRDMSDAEDLSARAARDKTIFDMGYRPTLDYVKETYGDGFEVRPEPPAPEPAAGPAFAEQPGALPAVADSVDELLANDGWRDVMGPQVDALEKLIADAGSLEAVRDRLGELAVSDPKALIDSLARVMFVARAAGNAAAEPDDGDG